MRRTANVWLSVRRDSTCSRNIRFVNALLYFPRCAGFAFVDTPMVCDDEHHEPCGRTFLLTPLEWQNTHTDQLQTRRTPPFSLVAVILVPQLYTFSDEENLELLWEEGSTTELWCRTDKGDSLGHRNILYILKKGEKPSETSEISQWTLKT